jgi:hypothetical protein
MNLSGAGFAINKPVLPYTLAPSASVDFTVDFKPTQPNSYSASLQVNSIITLLFGRGVAAATLTTVPGGSCSGPLANTITFSRTERRQTATCSIRLQNQYQSPITVRALSVAGAAFAGPFGINPPFTILPFETVVFQVQFTPPTSQRFDGALTIDTRTHTLAGTGFDPPVPTPTLEFDGAVDNAQQPALRLSLPRPSPIDAAGLIRIAFRSAVQGVTDDPAIVFTATNSRAVAFQIREGESAARFGNQSNVVFQTGTTAGEIQFLVEINGAPVGSTSDPAGSLSIARRPVVLDAARGSHRLNDLDIELIGFDNTYSAGLLSFTFFDTGGRAIEPGVIRADASADFRAHFSRSQAGSAFLLRATFPVTGDIAQIAGVEVEIANAQGSTRTERIAIK